MKKLLIGGLFAFLALSGTGTEKMLELEFGTETPQTWQWANRYGKLAEKTLEETPDGKKDLTITLSDPIKTYVAYGRNIRWETADRPEILELSFRSPDPGAYVIANYYSGAKVLSYQYFGLPPNREWTVDRFQLKIPDEADRLFLELRVKKPGVYHFRSVRLIAHPRKQMAYLMLNLKKKTGTPEIVFPSMKPDAKLREQLEKMGFTGVTAGVSEQLTLDYLKKFNLVLLMDTDLTLSPSDRERLRNVLKEYVEQGGGLLVTRRPGWHFGRDIEEFNFLLDPFGVKILNEQITDPAHQDRVFGEVNVFWTNNILSHPVTKNVQGLFYPDVKPSHEAYNDFSSPLRTDSNWAILVRGMKSASSYERKKASTILPRKPGSFSTEPPLIAVRSFGKGRVAVLPVVSSCFWQDGFHPFWNSGALMNGKLHEKRGDMLALVENLFQYLSEPSMGNFGGFFFTAQPKTAIEEGFQLFDWDRSRLKGVDFPHAYVGLIGARTGLSDGRGTPEEFIAAAKKAGYDFIAFTEPLAKMNEAKFNRLKQICAKAGNEKFQAYAGLEYQDESGNSWAVFGTKVTWPKPEWFSKKYPDRLEVNNPSTRAWGWPPVILLHSKRNPEPVWLQGNFNVFSVYTYRDGKLIDDSLDIYRDLSNDEFYMSIVAVHQVSSPEQVPTARKNGYQSWVRWGDNRVEDALSGAAGFGGTFRGKPYYFRSAFVSEGPIIEDFRILNFGITDLAVKNNDRWRMHLTVSSDAGLKEVEIMDGNRKGDWKRFLTGGVKFFESEIDGWHDHRFSPIPIVTDIHGKKAVGMRGTTMTQENCFLRCADNYNTMPRGKWWLIPSDMLNIRGFENYLTQRNFDYCGTPRFTTPWNENRYPAIHFRHELSSRFGTILTTRIAMHYPSNQDYFFDRTDNAEKAVPNEYYTSEVKYTLFAGRPDNTRLVLVETQIRILKDFEAKAPLIYSGGRQNCRYIAFTETNGKEELRKIEQGAFQGNVLPAGGYAVIGPHIFQGATGLIAASTGLSFRVDTILYKDRRLSYLNAFLGSGDRSFKKGEILHYKYISVLGKLNDPSENTDFVRHAIDSLGIGGKTPAYRVAPVSGSVLNTDFILRLKAADYAFNGTITKAELPMNLPVFIEGLNPNWDAGILYRGRNALLVPIMENDEFNRYYGKTEKREFTDELQHFPVMENGVGMLQIDTEFGDRNVFIGNVLTADNPDVRLTLLDRRPGKGAFEVHNPTDKPITCTVKPGEGFGLLGNFSKKITVPPGTSLRVNLE